MGARPPRSARRPPSTLTLAQAVDALADLAEAVGVDGQTARDEALSLAAAVAESAPGAAVDWTEATSDGATTQDFFDAASRGRRWRGSPTTTLSMLAARGSSRSAEYAALLAEVASAACQLGEPTMRVIGNASVAAAAQLSAVRQHGVATTSTAAAEADRGVLPTDPDGAGAAAAQAEPATSVPEQPEQPERSLEELLAELDGLIGLQRVKREIHRQVALLRVEKLRGEAGLRSPTHHPAPRLHRQPGHRQDDRRPARQRDLPGSRPALEGPARRGRPLRAGRGLPGPDGNEDRGRGRLGSRWRAVHRRGLQPDRDRTPR